jgi:hypothetical protein
MDEEQLCGFESPMNIWIKTPIENPYNIKRKEQKLKEKNDGSVNGHHSFLLITTPHFLSLFFSFFTP